MPHRQRAVFVPFPRIRCAGMLFSSGGVGPPPLVIFCVTAIFQSAIARLSCCREAAVPKTQSRLRLCRTTSERFSCLSRAPVARVCWSVAGAWGLRLSLFFIKFRRLNDDAKKGQDVVVHPALLHGAENLCGRRISSGQGGSRGQSRRRKGARAHPGCFLRAAPERLSAG